MYLNVFGRIKVNLRIVHHRVEMLGGFNVFNGFAVTKRKESDAFLFAFRYLFVCSSHESKEDRQAFNK
jgi:hypothetical protein